MGKTRPTRSPIEELRRHAASMIPGTMEGRIAEARPILHDNHEVEESVASTESEDVSGLTVKFFQDRHVITATGDQFVTLTHIPLDNSEHVYWGRIYLKGSYWVRSNNIIKVSDRGFKVGDIINIEYAYIINSVSQTIDGNDLTLIGVTERQPTNNNGSSNPVMFPIPSGAQTGDLMLLALLGGSLNGDANCTDPRLTKIDRGLYGTSFLGGWPYWIGYGTVGSNLSDIPTVLQGSGDAVGQFTEGVLLVFRNPSGKGSSMDTPWLVSSHGPYDSSTTRYMSYVPTAGQTHALAIFMSRAGVSGVVSPDWSKNDYKSFGNWSATYAEISVAQLNYGVAPHDSAHQTSPGANPSGQAWAEFVVGLYSPK